MNYHNISYPDMNNGDGLRVCLWLSSCSHHCPRCQNPQTWDCNSGIPFDQAAHDELFERLSKDYISGITFTGGDPLHENNLSGVLDLINEIKHLYPEKNIWLYSGYKVDYVDNKYGFVLNPSARNMVSNLPDSKIVELSQQDQVRSEIISKCDVLVDDRYIDELRDVSLKWRGSSNQRVISIQESLIQNEVILYCE